VVLPRAVVLLGVTSLLTDTSSELVFTLLPAFLAARFVDAPIILGAMEGVAELVAAGLKAVSGAWADRARRLKPLVVAGYGLAAVARPFMALATLAWHPVLVRAVDRVGKGLRTSPRDALLAASIPAERRGEAFGFHRGMDHAGAALGAGLAAALTALGLSPERVFLGSALPGAAGVAVLLLIREPERRPPAAPSGEAAHLPRRVWAFLLPVGLFALGNATDAFLLLRLSELGAPAPVLPLAWLLLHVVKSAVSWPAGRLADRLGHARVVKVGWALYAVSYLGLAWAASIPATLGLMAFYGLYHALAEGAEKALLAGLVTEGVRGRAFGLYHALTGVGALAGGLLFGVAWRQLGSGSAFVLAAVLAGSALGLLQVLLPRAQRA
jgi:MFS family permease